jgi:hypothetical protein
MASPVPAASLPDALVCQTPECPNAVSVVVTRLEDHEADALCMTCCMAFWASVLQKAAEAGLLGTVEQNAPSG